MSGYAELLGELFARRRFGMDLSLDRMKEALLRLDSPQGGATVVHIGGTNGKGSTAAMCDALLLSAGARVGRFTSPHLLRFTERFSICGREATQDEVVRAWHEVYEKTAELELTFFELATAIAFVLFRAAGCNVWVIEVGLGGRLDATNVLDSVASGVTSIALDHTEQLGSTHALIAREKAGIFRAGRPAYVALPGGDVGAEVEAVFREEANRVGAKLMLLGRDFARPEFSLSLIGEHQRSNAAIAIALARDAAREVGFSLDDAMIPAVLSQVKWPGRFEQLLPNVYCDGAHNGEGAAICADTMRALYPGKKWALVLATLADKNARAIVNPLCALADRVIVTAAPSERALSAENLAEVVRSAGFAPEICELPETAFIEAQRAPRALVAGSLFLVGAARKWALGERSDPLAVSERLRRQ